MPTLNSYRCLFSALAAMTLCATARGQGPVADPRMEIRAALEERAPFPIGPALLPSPALAVPRPQTLAPGALARERSLRVREEATAHAEDSAQKAVKAERGAAVGKSVAPGSERSSEGQAQSAAGRERANQAKKNAPLHPGPPRP